MEREERAKDPVAMKQHENYLKRKALGKKSKRKGKRFEKVVEARMQRMRLNVWRTPMSGALKAAGLLPQLKDHLAGDLRMKVGEEEEYIIECKSHKTAEPWWKRLEGEDVMYIKDCDAYIMNEETFQGYVQGVAFRDDYKIWGRPCKYLNDFFNQDNSNIVILGKNYFSPLYVIKRESLKKLFDISGKF